MDFCIVCLSIISIVMRDVELGIIKVLRMLREERMKTMKNNSTLPIKMSLARETPLTYRKARAKRKQFSQLTKLKKKS